MGPDAKTRENEGNGHEVENMSQHHATVRTVCSYNGVIQSALAMQLLFIMVITAYRRYIVHAASRRKKQGQEQMVEEGEIATSHQKCSSPYTAENQNGEGRDTEIYRARKEGKRGLNRCRQQGEGREWCCRQEGKKAT
jgi:hypothetical protein